MQVYTIPCHDGVYVNVMLVLQSCSDSLHILTSSSSDTCAASSDCAYHIGNVKGEEDLDMQGEEEEKEVTVKTEKDICSEEEDCIGVKDEEGRYSEGEEEDVNTKEEEDVDIKEEVSLEDTV